VFDYTIAILIPRSTIPMFSCHPIVLQSSMLETYIIAFSNDSSLTINQASIHTFIQKFGIYVKLAVRSIASMNKEKEYIIMNSISVSVAG
jgi:hypothetical protein